MLRLKKFGTTDLFVSEIGFGAWAIGGGSMVGNTPIGWGDADDNISIRAIHVALDAGVNFFDTADIYGLGHSEKLIGNTVGKRKDIIIATKVGNVARNNLFTVDYSKDYIFSACNASLERLQREVIDYYQLHTARLSHLQSGECIEAMDYLQEQGKIRYWGLSLNTFDPLPEAEYIIKRKSGNGFQLVLNLLNQKSLPILKTANSAGYGIIARMPFQFGLLTGKMNTDSVFPTNDHRHKRLTKDIIGTTLHVLDPVWQLCEKYNCDKTQLALSYILSYPEVSTVIPGIRTPEHAEMNTKGLFVLEPEDKMKIEELGKSDFIAVMERIQQLG